ncbi:MAG: FmdB family zinc ribbon protein [Bryobacteraceae bacterium]
MPLYEYRCEGCGEQFELIQKFSDQPVTTHDKCGGTVHRLLSAPALQFKGSGWYVNDYARASKPESDGASKQADSKPAKSSSSESSETTASTPTSPADKTTSSTTKSDTKNE